MLTEREEHARVILRENIEQAARDSDGLAIAGEPHVSTMLSQARALLAALDRLAPPKR